MANLVHGVNLTVSLEVTKVKMEMTVITLETVIVHYSEKTILHLNSTIFRIYLSQDLLMTWQQNGTMIRATFKTLSKILKIAV